MVNIKTQQIEAMKRGEKRPPEYEAWANMIRRCTNPNNPEYKNYGGRGIKVCDRWRDWKNFRDDMGPKPFPDHTLERLNNNGNYEPGNCAWRPWPDQCVNKRTNWMITINGETLCFKHWCKRFGINPATIRNRVRRAGMTVEQALTWPERKHYRHRNRIN